MATISVERVTELSCPCMVTAVCVSTHCHLACFVLCAQSSEQYVVCTLPQYKVVTQVTICVPYMCADKGREQVPHRPAPPARCKQSCRFYQFLKDADRKQNAKDAPVRCPGSLLVLSWKTVSPASKDPLCLRATVPSPQPGLWKLLFFFREICLTSTPTTHTLLGSMEIETNPQRKRDSQK